MKIYKLIFLVMFMTSTLSTLASALEIKATLGIHNNYIPDKNHHTSATGIGLYAEHESKSNVKSSAYFDLFYDDDKEEIDHDRDNEWFQAGLNIGTHIMQYSDDLYINFDFDAEMRENTVSSIEFYYKIFPGVIAEYKKHDYSVGLGLYSGYYCFESDDDIPKEAGYPYAQAKYESVAYSIKFNTLISLSEFFELAAVAQQWRDDSIWLNDKVAVDFIYDMSSLIRNSDFIISGEYNHYNYKMLETLNGINPKDFFIGEEWNFRTYARIAF